MFSLFLQMYFYLKEKNNYVFLIFNNLINGLLNSFPIGEWIRLVTGDAEVEKC